MKYQEQCELLEKTQLKADIYKFKVKTENIAKESKPGQFLEIKVSTQAEPFLRRPISIFSIEENNIEFIFQVKGKGTEILSNRNIGEKLDIIGPLGNGTFDIKEYKTVAIIGGGIGIFPLYEAAKQLQGKTQINTYLGFRNKDYVTNEAEFKKVSDNLIITTDDGSYGKKGFAIDYLKKDEKPDIIMACGPLPMLKAIKEYAEAEKSLDKAILQSPKVANLYINRALTRYNQDNLRGAMSDYDAAIEIAPNSYSARYNRGLLRANVGDDNLAIEDLNIVLELEPDNTIVLYNRALLLDNIGDYNGAIKDISAVIKDYPEFWEGYRKRAEIRRKIGDVYGAERDEYKLLKAQMAVATGTYKSSGKTRKKSEHNIADYDKLIEEDTHETENQYASEYRGKVQNKQSELKPEPLYIFTYYKNPSDVKLYVAYSKELDKLNARTILPATLYLTDDEGNMTESQLNAHLASITETTKAIDEKGVIEELLVKRALDYYHVRDFENGIADMDSYVLKFGEDVLSLMLRAQCRYAQLEVSSSTALATDLRLGYLMVLQDYTRALDILPQSPYLHYNIGCMMIKLSDYSAAINSFGKAIELDDHFPEAYYGRGVAYILNNQLPEGLSSLSQAGELGLYSAYNLIKKYSNEKK